MVQPACLSSDGLTRTMRVVLNSTCCKPTLLTGKGLLYKQRAASAVQVVPDFVTKIIQIFDCKVARHGNMIVGKTGAGKSVAWQTLQRALARLKKEEPENEQYQKARLQGPSTWAALCSLPCRHWVLAEHTTHMDCPHS